MEDKKLEKLTPEEVAQIQENLKALEKVEQEKKEDNIAQEKIEQKAIPFSYSKKINEPYYTTLSDFLAISKNFYAGFWVRLLAFLIDIILVGSLAALINTLTFGILDFGNVLIGTGQTFLGVTSYVLYFCLMTYFFNQTLGKMILGISVESNSGQKLTLMDVFMREIIGRFLITVLWLIPYLIVPFNKKKKGLNDFIADTVVVKDDFSPLRKKLNIALRAAK